DSSSSVVQYIRDNPIPFALVGIGIGMLTLNTRKRESSLYSSGNTLGPRTYGYSGTEDVSTNQPSMADRARDVASGVADKAREAGAIVGLALPTTRVEGEYMGETRDRLVDQAKTVAQEAVEKVQRVTEEAGRTLQDAAQKEGLVSDTQTSNQPAT